MIITDVEIDSSKRSGHDYTGQESVYLTRPQCYMVARAEADE